MTDLNKRVKRRSIAPHRGRRIVVSLEPGDLIGLREERTRKTYYFPIAAAFDFAVKMYVAAARRDKLKAKNAPRG
jgi:hypothetical protein